MKITIDESIASVATNCRLAYAVIANTVVRGTPPALTDEFFELQVAVAKAYDIEMLPTTPRILAVRSMYKKLNFDPARYRPASEALVRRVLQNKGLYYVNSAVDVNNYCSLKFLLPFGVYDMGNIQGDILYQLAPPGIYTNIAGNEVSTEGKPFLADEIGPFGNPTSDARRTAVTLGTGKLLSVVYADEEVADSELQEIIDFAADMLSRYTGGIIEAKGIVYAAQAK